MGAGVTDLLIVHLDASIFGGAERLLKNLSEAYKGPVTILTAKRPSTDWPGVTFLVPPFQIKYAIPTMIALQAMVQMLLLFLYGTYHLFRHRRGSKYSLVLSDQMAYLNPLFKLLGASVIFYCHFPEPLLQDGRRKSLSRRIYRTAINWADSIGMKYADSVLCNSRFTLLNFLETYGPIHSPKILYPCVSEDLDHNENLEDSQIEMLMKENCESEPASKFLLSLNRFEPKKKHERAIKALFAYIGARDDKDVCLICCGGLHVLDECYLNYLKQLALKEALKQGLACQKCKNQHIVKFLVNCEDRQRRWLLAHCHATLYTSSNEHFGIVPLESMAYGKPVIAMNSGGPRETVNPSVTGYLVEDNANAIDEMARRIGDVFQQGDGMRMDCLKRAEEFSFNSFVCNVAMHLR